MERTSIAGNLVLQRKRKGMTQEQLSDSSGVTVRTIQRIEAGKVDPHFQTLSLLARSLGLDVQELSPAPEEKPTIYQPSDERKWLILLHLLPIVGIIIPFANLIIPLLLWVYKRDEILQYKEEGRAVINFHLTIVIAYMISVILLVFYFPAGFPLMILTALYCIIMILWNTRLVAGGMRCYYPLSVKFL